MEDTYKCYIEADGNVVTRKPDGRLIPQLTGNWTILHKVYKYASGDAKFKSKVSSLEPDLYIGKIVYIIRHPGRGTAFTVSSTFIANLLKYIKKESKVQFGGLETCE